MLLADLAATSQVVTATAKRTGKTGAIAAALTAADPDEVPVVVAYLAGELRQRRTGIGFASLRELPPPAMEATLGVSQVDLELQEVSALAGPGSQGERAARVRALFGRATGPEQQLLRGLITADLRQGALEGVMLAAVAQASALPLADVRRAAMLAGGVGPVAAAALTGGAEALAEFRLQVGRPVQPMLASTATDVEDGLGRLGEAAVEWKLDGVRVQVHRSGSEVSVWTRSLEEITDRVPEVVAAALALPVSEVVLDGEAIALRPDGRPRPFQETGSRVSSRTDVAAAATRTPLTTYLFDVLHVDGEDVLDRPGHERAALLARIVPEPQRVPRVVTASAAVAAQVLAEAMARGHEGVVIKSLDDRYEAGRRGVGWLKVKPRHTLDLVVLAAEWGSGRRRGWLSNLHLAARDADGRLVMLGKTFKGLTDEMLRWQTERLQELAVTSDDWVVRVRPELVVEVAIDGVQTSPRYPAGMALRFARVIRHRPDKPASEADSVETVRAIHALTNADGGQ